MKNYYPATGDDTFPDSTNDPSGAYLFKPVGNDQTKHAYSDYGHIDQWVGPNTGVHMFSIYYSDENKERLYTTNVQVIPGVRELKWNVHLHGIPIKDDLKGKEVVVNWELEDFTNSGVFYTDSNGLEM